MKKINVAVFVLFFALVTQGFSQSASAVAPASEDFFAGKWEISLFGLPDGDGKLVTNLVRKEGQLKGELADPSKPDAEKIPITKVDEGTDKIEIFFTAQGFEVTIELAKVDNDSLKGSMMNMFDAKATRVKE